MNILSLLAQNQKTGGIGSYLPILLIGLFAVFYFAVLRPKQKAQRAQQAQSRQVEPGDIVVTIGGVHGRVVSVDGDHVTIATGQEAGTDPSLTEGTRLTFVKQAIAKKVDPVATPAAPEIEGPAEGDEGEGQDPSI